MLQNIERSTLGHFRQLVHKDSDNVLSGDTLAYGSPVY